MKYCIGLETEYGIFHSNSETRNYEKLASILTARFGSGPKGFLINGGRFYMDAGAHPEYATPECATILDLIAADKAGEQFLFERLVEHRDQIRREVGLGEVILLKNNLDATGIYSSTTFGCHENYYALRGEATDGPGLVLSLAPHLVSRIPLSGAGHLYTNGKYILLSRSNMLPELVGSGTTKNRSLICTKDEPHTDHTHRRIHLLAGDSNMSEYSILLKAGTTALILLLIQSGEAFDDASLALAEPIKALKQVSEDLTLSQKIELCDGRSLTALEIQKEYHERTAYHLAGENIPDLDLILGIWGEMLERAEREPASLSRYLDAWAKKKLLEDYARTRGLPMTHPIVQYVNYTYHDISPNGWYNRMAAKGKIHTVVPPALIKERLFDPPLTRAKLRSDFKKWAKRRRVLYRIEWSQVSYDHGQDSVTVRLPDPFVFSDDRVKSLIS